MTIVKSPQFQENKVVSLVHELIPTAKQVGNIGAELSYILDHESARAFKDLFEHFEGGSFRYPTWTFKIGYIRAMMPLI